MICFCNIVYVYICKKRERYDGCWQLFSWLGQKVTYNRACKSRARKRGWGQLGAGNPYSPS